MRPPARQPTVAGGERRGEQQVQGHQPVVGADHGERGERERGRRHPRVVRVHAPDPVPPRHEERAGEERGHDDRRVDAGGIADDEDVEQDAAREREQEDTAGGAGHRLSSRADRVGGPAGFETMRGRRVLRRRLGRPWPVARWRA